MHRADNLNYRRSLQRVMEGSGPAEIEATARRQERTVDALLSRLYNEDPGCRRELVLLADEVGLGKTFVALGAAWSVLAQREAAGLPARPVLIVTPGAHALYNKWQREAETFFRDIVDVDPHHKVVAVETPHDVVNALRSRQSRLVIARMSAFSGRLSSYDRALAAVLHVLFREMEPALNVDQRLKLIAGWTCMESREAVSLKSSACYLREAKDDQWVGFSESRIRAAMCRLNHVDRGVIDRLQQSFSRTARGQERRSDFWVDLRELARAAMGQRINGTIPLVIVDEIHNWKNHPQSWHRFLHTLGGRVERMLGLSATPFQLGPHELSQVLDLRRCLLLDDERVAALNECADKLAKRMANAHESGKRVRHAWAAVNEKDLPELHAAWRALHANSPLTIPLPPHLSVVLDAVEALKSAHEQLTANLRPFLVRHRRDLSHRRWWVGRYADPASSQVSMHGSSLQWQPGMDIVGDAELLHYLMMRVTQEQKNGKGATDLGADLGGSYDFFRERKLPSLQTECTTVPSAQPYLKLVEQATGPGTSQEHPKIKVTADRAFSAWLRGDKTLVFCFNRKTVDAVHDAVNARILEHQRGVLANAFDCREVDLPKRWANFRNSLYDYQKSLFLMFQDHPLAGPEGRVPPALAIGPSDLTTIAQKLAAAGVSANRSRLDRRRILAFAEQALVDRWKGDPTGEAWLAQALLFWKGRKSLREALDEISSPDWHLQRASLIQGVQRGHETGQHDNEGESYDGTDISGSEYVMAWEGLLVSQAGRAVLAPYLSDADISIPSLLTRWHAPALHRLPQPARRLATRMLRGMVREPGFLARFLLDDPSTKPVLARGGDESDTHWTPLLHSRWIMPPVGGESARDRFSVYLDSLCKVADTNKRLDENRSFSAYEAASRNQKVVAKISGSSDTKDRDRHFVGFNTPSVPEVLIVTSVGQEGIDLHRECRHVIHHDLPWNPALLEQRTGRVDRIGSKASRMAVADPSQGHLDVVVPYIANTYDEHRFRVVHGRSRLFDVTMGGNYDVEGRLGSRDVMEEDKLTDDINADVGGAMVVPLPSEIADALRIRLEAE